MKNYLFGLLCIICSFGCKKEIEITKSTEITGLVRSTFNKAPLDSASVTLYSVNEYGQLQPLEHSFTDPNGSFRFNFTDQEGNYRIYINRRGYRFTPSLTNKFFDLRAVYEFQEVVATGQKQHFTLDLAPEAILFIKLKNISPIWPDDELKLEVGKNTLAHPSLHANYTGFTDMDLLVGLIDGKTTIPLKYEVRNNDVWHTIHDSIVVQPLKTTYYQLHY